MFKLWKKLPKRIKNKVAIGWYEALSRFNSGDDLAFMNHGFAPMRGDPEIIELPASLENDRYAIQLYHVLADTISWRGKHVVEISSGRGGGAAYIFYFFKPETYLGVDLARSAVDHCNETYADRHGLSFMVGDAQEMPLHDACCDILINVESSVNYPDQESFFSEVNRVLRPGGFLLLQDHRTAKKMDLLKKSLTDLNFELVKMEDISSNVARALRLDDPRKQELLLQRVPKPFRRLVGEFSFTGAAARDEIDRFRNGKKCYIMAVLRKPLLN